jgi:hypothetical protein
VARNIFINTQEARENVNDREPHHVARDFPFCAAASNTSLAQFTHNYWQLIEISITPQLQRGRVIEMRYVGNRESF